MNKKIKFIFNEKPLIHKLIMENYSMSFRYIFNQNIKEYRRKIFFKSKNDESKIIEKVWFHIFGEKILFKIDKIEKITKEGQHFDLTFNEIIILDIVLSIVLSKQSKIYIPIINDICIGSQPLRLYEISKEILNFKDIKIYFITNDIYWISIFSETLIFNGSNEKIPFLDFFWVESELDLFTYSILFPNGYFKIAGSSSNIFKILFKNPKHKTIIDKDGFTEKNIKHLKEKFNIYFTKMAECENIWIKPDMIEKINNFSPRKIDLSEFKKSTIEKAKKNLNNVILRFKNRQDYLMYNFIPFLNDQEIGKFKLNCISDISEKNYEKILTWFDNKKIFDIYLKQLGYNNIEHWKNDIIAHKDIFAIEKQNLELY